MGTYTTNKNLFMPTVGETGWGTLVNNNFSTIDTFLKPITVSGSTYTFTGNHVGNQSGGSVSATSITNSGTLTNTGKINGATITSTKFNGATIDASGNITGAKGTFSGDVSGGHAIFKSIKGCHRYYKYLLIDNNTELLDVNKLTLGYSNIVSNGTFQINLLGIVSRTPNGTTTYNYTPYLLNTDYGGHLYCEDIIVKSGSWSYTLETNNEVVTATVTDCIGETYTANYTGTRLTLAQVKTLLTGKNTITVVNTNTTSTNGSINIVVKNTSSSSIYRYFIYHDLP